MHCEQITSLCGGCPGRIVCRCLRVSEEAIVDAITTLELRSVKEVRRHTEAGDGCTCCHGEIRALIEQHAVVRAACA